MQIVLAFSVLPPCTQRGPPIWIKQKKERGEGVHALKPERRVGAGGNLSRPPHPLTPCTMDSVAVKTQRGIGGRREGGQQKNKLLSSVSRQLEKTLRRPKWCHVLTLEHKGSVMPLGTMFHAYKERGGGGKGARESVTQTGRRNVGCGHIWWLAAVESKFTHWCLED